MGIAKKLLTQVCKDAAEDGYSFAEAYPVTHLSNDSLAFTGPLRLYEKAGFTEYNRIGRAIMMRKALN